MADFRPADTAKSPRLAGERGESSQYHCPDYKGKFKLDENAPGLALILLPCENSGE
jgi:hypothetical protein